MGDDEDAGAAAGGEPGEAALEVGGALGVEVRGRLVEDQEAGLGEEHAGGGDPLALAAGDVGAGLADLGVEALRQRVDPGAEADRLERGVDLGVGGAGAAEADVVAQRRREQVGVLGREADRVADRVAAHRGGRPAADRHPAGDRVAEADRDLGQGALAGAAGPEQGQGAARAQPQVGAVEDPLAAALVAEADALAARRSPGGGASGCGRLARPPARARAAPRSGPRRRRRRRRWSPPPRAAPPPRRRPAPAAPALPASPRRGRRCRPPGSRRRGRRRRRRPPAPWRSRRRGRR